MPKDRSGWWRITVSSARDIHATDAMTTSTQKAIHMKGSTSKSWLLGSFMALFTGAAMSADMPAIKPVAKVDLPRFMGSWYVIASIPSFVEKKAYNAIETYQLQPDGTIDTSFRYRKSSFDAPVKTIHSTGFVTPNSGNAVWGVQLLWPIKAQYLIAYLDEGYNQTIIARDKRDYVWIMAKTPTIPQADYDALVARVKALGYDLSGLRKVPQAWPEKAASGTER
jgi:apolipoprotein D and lipocalin family protein